MRRTCNRALANVLIILSATVFSWAGQPGDIRIRGDDLLGLFLSTGGDIHYRIGGCVVPDSEKRAIFERVINEVIFGAEPGQDTTSELKRLGIEEEFLKVMVEIRNSAAWADGARFGAYDVLLLDEFQPAGAVLAASGIRADAVECRPERIGIFALVDLVVYSSPETRSAFIAVAECAIVREDAALLATAAVGLTRSGDPDSAHRLLSKGLAAFEGNATMTAVLRRTLAAIDKLPRAEDELRELLDRLAISGPF